VAGGSNGSQVSSLNLLLPLLKGREFLVVLLEVLIELLKLILNFLVDPRLFLELDDQIERVDHGEMLEAVLISLDVVEKHADDTDDLLCVEVVQHFGYGLDNVVAIVGELNQSELMVGKNPESQDNIVSYLSSVVASDAFIIDANAVTSQDVLKGVEAIIRDEGLSEFVGLAVDSKGIGESSH